MLLYARKALAPTDSDARGLICDRTDFVDPDPRGRQDANRGY